MKTILLFLFLCMSLSTSAQTADERAGTYMNQENWFSLQREFAVNKDSLHPFLQEFGQALLDNFFNRPQAAYESIGKLLNEQQSNMGFENTASMIYLLSENLSKLGANDQAAETLKNFCDQVEGQVDSTFLAGYRRKEKEYRALSKYALYQWEKPDTDLALPIRIDSVGPKGSGATAIAMEGSVNGKERNFILDTGASVNVVTPEVAKACGMKILDVEATANGIGTGSGQFAIAEEIQLDLRNNRMIIPKELTPTPGFAPNICFTGKNLLNLEIVYDHELLQMNFDSGSCLSHLNYDYFEQHKDRIERIAERDSMGLGGFGGTAWVCIYKLPGACFQIGEYTGCTDSLNVVATPEQDALHFAGDGIVGMDMFRSFSTITINLKDMFVKTTPKMQGKNAMIYDSKKLRLKLPEDQLNITDILLGIADIYLNYWNDHR